MAGIPYHALEGYLATMLEEGWRCAVVDQLENPKEARVWSNVASPES